MGDVVGFRVVQPPDPLQHLRDLTRQVKSREEFERILADVNGPPELLEAVRDLLLPLLPQEVIDAIGQERE